MSLDFEQFEKVDWRTKALINGYVKQLNKLLNSKDNQLFDNIPLLVIYACTLYYYETEFFEKAGNDLEIIDKITIKKLQNESNWSNAVYGAQWYSSNKNNIITWNFKCIKNAGGTKRSRCKKCLFIF